MFEVWLLVWCGVIGVVIVWISFGGVMFVICLDKVGEVVVLCEILIVFVVLIGWLLLGEKVGLCKVILMVVIVLGVVFVEIGG